MVRLVYAAMALCALATTLVIVRGLFGFIEDVGWTAAVLVVPIAALFLAIAWLLDRL